MTERPVAPSHQCSAPDWLRRAADTLRQAARDATPGPWRGGDPNVGAAGLERYRTTVEHFATPTAFPAVRPTRSPGEPVLPGLRDPLETFEGALRPVPSRVPINARWIAMVSPLIAGPLATVLHSLAEHLEVTIQAGGSAEEEPYRSAVTLAKIIVAATADSTGPRIES